MLELLRQLKRPYVKKTWLDVVHIDPWILLILLGLFSLGALVVFSAAGQSDARVIQHLQRGGFALLLLLVVAQIPPNAWRMLAVVSYVGGVVLLILVAVTGDMGKGAQRWLDLGFLRFQPSEIMKIALPLTIAWIMANSRFPPSWLQIMSALVVIAVPTLLILKQPDLGTSILIAASGLFVLFFAGLSWKLIAGAMAAVGASLPLLWHYVLLPYQKGRVLTFLDPERDPLGAGYHIIQSKIAIGSGGWDGKGWLEGTQSQLAFLPERTTDFIFSVYAEEFGLFGVMMLFAIFFALILRGFFIAYMAQGNFNRLVAASLTMTFFVYLFVNVGMVSGLLPVVGVPLPLFSYGGTSLITLAISFGILMSIHTHRKLLSDD